MGFGRRGVWRREHEALEGGCGDQQTNFGYRCGRRHLLQVGCMSTADVLPLLDDVIKSATPGPVTEELLQKLQFFFPDSLILAALDLIDRDCVILYSSPLGRTHLQVVGSTARYSVRYLEEGTWCDCPAFTFSVLLSHTHYMHVLASRLAERMNRVVRRSLGFEEWADLISSNHIIQMH